MVSYHKFLCNKLHMYTPDGHQIILLTTAAMLEPSNGFRQLNGTLLTIQVCNYGARRISANKIMISSYQETKFKYNPHQMKI